MKNIDFENLILFENTDFLVINKPSGISTLQDRNDEINLLELAKKYYSKIQVCHRIDKETSGVLVFSKNPEAYKHLSLKFQKRAVNKIYHAVVIGKTEYNDLMIDVPLVEKSNGIVKWDKKLGKVSQTVFTTLQNYSSASLIECRPITGRKHQIRVHLKYLNHVIIADELYNGENIFLSSIKKNYRPNQREEQPLIQRMALHAYSISFKSIDEKTYTIKAPYPKDFQILLKQLNKYSNYSVQYGN